MDMENKLIGVRLPSALLKEVESAARRGGYGSLQDYIRETLRKETLLRAVNRYAGSLPSAKQQTRKSRDEAYKEFRN